MEETLPPAKNTKEFNLFLPIVCALLVILTLGATWKLSALKKQAATPAPATLGANEVVLPKQVTVTIRDQDEKTFNADWQADDTAWSVLQGLAAEGKITLDSQQYDFGIMVKEINGVKGGEGGKYWMYYVNGNPPSIGADSYILGPGDSILWVLE